MNYKVVIEPRALIDIQDAVDYYDSKSEGLGIRFYNTLESHIRILAKTPFFNCDIKSITHFLF